MATIKLEILLDSNEQTDVFAFSNLMNAFSGSITVPVGLGKSAAISAPVQSPSTQVTATEAEQIAETTREEEYQNGYEYSEAEMLKLPNTELKDYATGLGIDWAKAEGKNTNRKLADLVLEFRKYVESSKNDTATNANPFAPDEDEKAEDEKAEDTTAEENEEAATEGGVDYNDLKVSLGKKVDEHREAIVAKLAEFGATKMPNLAEEHWTDMFNFMEAL